MAEGDRIRVQFTETEALAQQLLDKLAEDIAQASAIGDELEVARLQAKRAAIGGPQQYVRETPQIEQDTAALNQENIARGRGLEVELQTLEVLKQQLAERLALEDAIRGGRFGAPPAQPGASLAGGTRFGMGYGGLAGQQVLAAEVAEAAKLEAEEAAITRELEQQAVLRERAIAQARDVGFAAGAGGQRVGDRASVVSPIGVAGWTEADRAAARYNLTLGEYEGFASRAGQASNALTADLTRLGMVQAEASNEMRAHGALTTEWLGSLARGETTLSEFGYQMGQTIGKVAGWTAATTATFAALGAFVELGKGAIDSASGVQQLNRTIEHLDTEKAAQDIRQLSQDTNVSVKEASDAIFQYSRTFHSLPDAVSAARSGLEVFHLDNVALADSVKLSTALTQQWGLTAQGLGGIYDMLSSGQREYNARISQMVPFLQAASGAAKNAGGDLTELIQIGIAAQRITQFSGANLGTMFQRALTTYIPKNAGALADQYGLGRDINPLTGQGNLLQLLVDAIKEGQHLSNPERRALASQIFDPRFAGRLASLFGPQGGQLLAEVQGGRHPITPDATKGTTQEEFDKQMAQVQQRLHAFVYAIQDLGSALAQTGALAPLGLALEGAIAGLHALTGLISEFDKLPQPLREIISLFVELRLAMLFISRTRIGSSIVPQSLAGAVSRIPGMGATAETQLRGELAGGTRQALKEIESQYVQVVGQATTTGARAAALERQRLAYVEQRGGLEAMEPAQVEKANAMSARVNALKEEQLTLETQQAALEAERVALNEQMVGLTASRMNPSARYSKDELLGVASMAGANTSAVEEEASLGTASMAMSRVKGAVGGVVGRARAFLLGLDRLTVGLVVLPIAYQSISDALNAQSDALAQVTKAANAPIHSAQDLQDAANRMREGASKTSKGPGGMFGDFIAAGEGYSYLSQGAEAKGLSEQTGALGALYSHAAALFQKDGADLIKTRAGREELSQEADRLRITMARAVAQSDMSLPEALRVMKAFSQTLKSEQDALATNSNLQGPNVFAVIAKLAPKQIEQHLQALDDMSKVFGTQGAGGAALRSASLQYAAMVNDSRKWVGAGGKSPDDASLQALASAQQNLVNAVNKNVQDLLHKASMDTSNRGETTDISKAVDLLNNERSQVQRSFAQAIAYAQKAHEGAAAVKLLQEAESQMLASLADLHKTVIDAAISQIQSEGDLATSEIQGISQLSDIQRARSQADTAARELAYAKSHGASAQTINDLQTKLNNQNLALLKQNTDYGRSLTDSSGALAISRVTGISPQADIQRAQLAVTRASQILAYDQGHGADQATINQDMANLNDAQRTLNQQIQSRSQQIDQDAAAFIQATAAYQESRTTDPVRAASEQLKADIAVLATIKPQDYRTYQEYQTAWLNQRAKIGDEVKSKRQAIVDKDMQTLNFELHTQRITDQEYIAGLERLLKMKHLSLQQRQTIESALFDAMHQTAVNLNVGSIRMPTAYEVRSAIARGHAAARSGRPPTEGMMVQSNTTNHFNMTFHIDSRRDPHIRAVTDAVHKALTQTDSQAQSVGMV